VTKLRYKKAIHQANAGPPAVEGLAGSNAARSGRQTLGSILFTCDPSI
jgi:hypothetical protein